MQRWSPAVQQGLRSASPQLRAVSLSVLFLEVKQGLEYPVDCVASVVALLLDEGHGVGVRADCEVDAGAGAGASAVHQHVLPRHLRVARGAGDDPGGS